MPPISQSFTNWRKEESYTANCILSQLYKLSVWCQIPLKGPSLLLTVFVMFNLRVTFKFKWWVPKNESKALKMASEGKGTEGGRARFDRFFTNCFRWCGPQTDEWGFMSIVVMPCRLRQWRLAHCLVSSWQQPLCRLTAAVSFQTSEGGKPWSSALAWRACDISLCLGGNGTESWNASQQPKIFGIRGICMSFDSWPRLSAVTLS